MPILTLILSRFCRYTTFSVKFLKYSAKHQYILVHINSSSHISCSVETITPCCNNVIKASKLRNMSQGICCDLYLYSHWISHVDINWIVWTGFSEKGEKLFSPLPKIWQQSQARQSQGQHWHLGLIWIHGGQSFCGYHAWYLCHYWAYL